MTTTVILIGLLYVLDAAPIHIRDRLPQDWTVDDCKALVKQINAQEGVSLKQWDCSTGDGK